MKCQACGRHIAPNIKFCPHCGKPASPRQSDKPRAQSTKSKWPLYVMLVIVGIAIGVFAFRWLQEQKPATAAAAGFDPTLRGEQLAQLYPAVFEVASQFNCPCGSCSDGIEVCDCEMERGAAEVRLFIYQLLQVHQPAHAIEIVAQKYGHRKDGAAAPPPVWQAPSSSNQ
jgi:hypothetical protein